MLFKQFAPVLYLGSLVYGTVYALSTTMPSLLLLDLYGKEQYQGKVSSLQAVSGLVFAFSNSGFPYLYDLTGSFDIVFVLGAVLCAVAFVLAGRLQRYAARRPAQASPALEQAA